MCTCRVRFVRQPCKYNRIYFVRFDLQVFSTSQAIVSCHIVTISVNTVATAGTLAAAACVMLNDAFAFTIEHRYIYRRCERNKR